MNDFVDDETLILSEEEENALVKSLLPPDSESEEETVEAEPDPEPEHHCFFCDALCVEEYCETCYSLLYMTYPEDFHNQNAIRCTNCGGDCEGSDYEHWNLCSRECMVEYSK